MTTRAWMSGATALLLAGSAIAQCSEVQIDFPNTPAFKVLKPQHANNPWGIPPIPDPNCQNKTINWWPVSVTMGDIDNDGHDDLLYCCEQRFLLAVRLKDATGNVLMTPEVIWLHFNFNAQDPTVDKHMYKAAWGSDTPRIADFDGDGKNEVAAVIDSGTVVTDPNNLPSYRIAVFEDSPSGVVNVLGVPSPNIAVTMDIDTLVHDFTSSPTSCLAGESGSSNYVVHPFKYRPNDPPGVYFQTTAGGRLAILKYQELPSPTFTVIRTRGYHATSGHWIQPYDIDGDGVDELLDNGVNDIMDGNAWELSALTLTDPDGGQTNNNHADAVIPWDGPNGPLLMLHDGFDVLVQHDPINYQPTLLWENTLKNDGTTDAIYHGQLGVVARLLNTASPFPGLMGRQAVTAPKGPPLHNFGSVVINEFGEELAESNNKNVNFPEGPQLSILKVVQFNGGVAEEILSKADDTSSGPSVDRYSVWRLAAKNPVDPLEPYEWQEVCGHNVEKGQGKVLVRTAIPNDFYPGGNEEIILPGIRGYIIWSHP